MGNILEATILIEKFQGEVLLPRIPMIPSGSPIPFKRLQFPIHLAFAMTINKSQEKIELREDLKSRRGLAVSLEIICHNCEESTSTMSSKISNKCYDVNLRLTYGMRAIGKGGAAARIFCGLMNLPPPPAKF
ncbi:uncharacterized protein TNCV_2831371 [Trichonephila clavipes]|nr:uncharacterized protein TNCV_2831371 [Trichonephila clavipes]